MIARIGLPGNSYHDYQRGLTKTEAEDWCQVALNHRYPNGDYPFDAKTSIITEAAANKAKFRDGTPCYPDHSREITT